MKLSELTDLQKEHLAWRLDNKTYVGLLTMFTWKEKITAAGNLQYNLYYQGEHAGQLDKLNPSLYDRPYRATFAQISGGYNPGANPHLPEFQMHSFRRLSSARMMAECIALDIILRRGLFDCGPK